MRNKLNLLTQEQVFKRAGGRRRYNRERQMAALKRRDEVWRLLKLYGPQRRGTQARIARELQVSRATVCRDSAGFKLAAQFDVLFDRLFPAPALDEQDDWEAALAALAEWPDHAATWPEPKPRASLSAHDRRGGARPGAAGRKPKFRREEFDVGWLALLGTDPAEWQLEMACQKLIERSLRGNLDAFHLVMAEAYGAP